MKQSMVAILLALVLVPAYSDGNRDAQIADLCRQISAEMIEMKRSTIAVVEFSDLEGQVTDLGRFLSEEVITGLYKTKKFKVIERQMLNKVLSEQNLQLSGAIDENSAKKIGKLLGVDAIVSGTVSELAMTVKINARLIGTETGEIFGAASAEILKDDSITRLLAAGGGPGGSAAPAPGAAKKTVSGAGKTTFKDQTFEQPNLMKISLVSIERLENNYLLATYVLENLNKATLSYSLRESNERSFIVDDMGTQIRFLECVGLSTTDWKALPPGIPYRFTVKYDKLPAEAEKINVVVYVNVWNGGNFDVVFRNIELK